MSEMRTIGTWVVSNDPTQTAGKVIAIDGTTVTVHFSGLEKPTVFYGGEFESSCDPLFVDHIFAVVVATRTGTRFVSHHRTYEGALRASEKHNARFPRGARATATGINVEK